jgi:hypothetical protein
MTEFVEAHASYRFIILDEEDERARILVRGSMHYHWLLLTPMCRFGYSSPICGLHIPRKRSTPCPGAHLFAPQRCYTSCWGRPRRLRTLRGMSCRFPDVPSSTHRPSQYTANLPRISAGGISLLPHGHLSPAGGPTQGEQWVLPGEHAYDDWIRGRLAAPRLIESQSSHDINYQTHNLY